MPTYDYECQACGHAFEKLQMMSDKLLRKCPKCGARKLARLIGSGGGLIFKGSGFYSTDYRSKGYQDAAKADAAASAGGATKDAAATKDGSTAKDSSAPPSSAKESGAQEGSDRAKETSRSKAPDSAKETDRSATSDRSKTARSSSEKRPSGGPKNPATSKDRGNKKPAK